eukprot:1158384-Pelagomonas_calceolata.AAC.10
MHVIIQRWTAPVQEEGDIQPMLLKAELGLFPAWGCALGMLELLLESCALPPLGAVHSECLELLVAAGQLRSPSPGGCALGMFGVAGAVHFECLICCWTACAAHLLRVMLCHWLLCSGCSSSAQSDALSLAPLLRMQVIGSEYMQLIDSRLLSLPHLPRV